MAAVADTRPNPYAAASARWWTLILLTVVYVFNFIDRQILSILQEPIKRDLGLSDAQLGLLADRLAAKDKRWYAWLPALAMLISAPVYIAVFLMTDPTLILLVNVLPMFLSNVFSALSITMVHGMVAPNMRAMGSALIFLIFNIIGLGLGPWLVGIASDMLVPERGKESLRYALLYIAPPVALASGLLYWRAARFLREDMARAPM